MDFLIFQVPMLTLQATLDGVLLGILFALIAYGMALQWGVMNIINIAQGDLVILGGYIAYFMYLYGIHPAWGVIVSPFIMYFVGVGIYKLVINKVVDRDLFISILATFGISIMIQQIMNMIFGSQVETALSGFGTIFFFNGNITIALIKLFSFVVCILGAISVIYYAKKNGIKLLHLIDVFAPSLILAYGIGRAGCHFSGDGDWGIVASNKPDWWFLPDWMWSYNYPNNVINEGIPIPGCEGNFCYQLAENVYPTPFYEIIMAGIIFLFLWSIRKKIKIAGMLFFIYLTLNGIERFFIEKIRVNTKYDILGGITQAEIISSILILTGIIGIFVLIKEKQNYSQ